MSRIVDAEAVIAGIPVAVLGALPDGEEAAIRACGEVGGKLVAGGVGIELELRAEDAMITDEERDVAVDEFIDLVCAVDGILQAQAPADAAYFVATCGRSVSAAEEQILSDMMLKAYRWTYILSGAEHRQFVKVVGELLTETQITRVMDALETLR